jgi:anti-sigma factor RsiW
MNRQTTPWVESMLVAYVDGQLDPAQMAAVDDIIREDPEARTIVSVLRGTGEAIRAAFEQPLHESVPPRLLAVLGAAGEGSAAGKVVPLRRPAKSVPMRQLLTALAASIAILFVGIGVGYLEFAPAGSIGPAVAESSRFEATLYRALEGDKPGVSVSYDDAATGRSGAVTVAGKIASQLGNDCREFQHQWTDAHGKGLETGLACRSATGDWSILTVPREPAS